MYELSRQRFVSTLSLFVRLVQGVPDRREARAQKKKGKREKDMALNRLNLPAYYGDLKNVTKPVRNVET